MEFMYVERDRLIGVDRWLNCVQPIHQKNAFEILRDTFSTKRFCEEILSISSTPTKREINLMENPSYRLSSESNFEYNSLPSKMCPSVVLRATTAAFAIPIFFWIFLRTSNHCCCFFFLVCTFRMKWCPNFRVPRHYMLKHKCKRHTLRSTQTVLKLIIFSRAKKPLTLGIMFT